MWCENPGCMRKCLGFPGDEIRVCPEVRQCSRFWMPGSGLIEPPLKFYQRPAMCQDVESPAAQVSGLPEVWQ